MLVTMSDKELSRINVIQSVVEKRMRRRDAAQLLALTERQTQRLMNRFRESGAAGLANLRFGRVLSELGIELICANSPQAKSVWSEQIRQFRTDLSRKCVLKESAALKQRTPGWLLS